MNKQRSMRMRLETGYIRPYLPGIIAFLFVASLTLGGFLLIRMNYRMAAQAEFEQAAQERMVAVRRSFRDKLLILESMHSMYSVFPGQPGQEFRAFVRPFEVELEGLQALQWTTRVLDAQRDSYEQELQLAGYTGYQITEREDQGRMVRAARREEYFPIFPLDPPAQNELSTGFDLASEPVRREALERARDLGEIIATSRVQLVQEQVPDQFGFLVFAPVYTSGSTPATIAERRASLRGFVIAVFRFSDIVEAALGVLNPQGVDLVLRDLSAREDEQLLYEHPSRTRGKTPETEGRMNFRPDDYVMNLEVGGRTWTMTGSAAPYFMASQRRPAEWVILMAGLTFGVFLAIYLIVTNKQAVQMRAAEAALVRAQSELERRVEERTRDLKLAQEELLHRSRLATLGQLTATVSHELRNPLGTALSSIDFLEQLLQHNEMGKAARTALERLSRAISRCDRIIDELLDYTRLRARVSKTLDLNNQLLANLDEHPLPEDVVLRTSLATGNIYVTVDEELLRRALINIIDNACQAMAENQNGKLLEVMTEKMDGRCRVMVRDNGPGMTDDVQTKIFDPLYSTKTYGVGLGMAIVKQIMEQLHGEVGIESTAGQGTAVSLWLPLSDQPLS